MTSSSGAKLKRRIVETVLKVKYQKCPLRGADTGEKTLPTCCWLSLWRFESIGKFLLRSHRLRKRYFKQPRTVGIKKLLTIFSQSF
jgi:hypothetical protein